MVLAPVFDFRSNNLLITELKSLCHGFLDSDEVWVCFVLQEWSRH